MNGRYLSTGGRFGDSRGGWFLGLPATMHPVVPRLRSQMERAFRSSAMKTAFLRLPAAIAALGLSACASKLAPTSATSSSASTVPITSMATKPPLRTVPKVDLPRFMGDWRVIANIPYFAERGNVDSIESYQLRPDGLIGNGFAYRKESFDAPQKKMAFIAEVKNKDTNAEWRVRFLPFVKVAYLIIDLDQDYQWTVIGHPSRKWGWIMGREKTMPDALYNAILSRLTAQGYDPEKFAKVPQTREQLASGEVKIAR